MKFHEKLYNLRKDKRMSQEELAEKLEISRQAVSKWETGDSLPETQNCWLLQNTLMYLLIICLMIMRLNTVFKKYQILMQAI